MSSDTVKTLSASVLAGLLTTPPQGTPEAQARGMHIHEAVQSLAWLRYRAIIPYLSSSKYADDESDGWECDLCGEVFSWGSGYYQPQYTDLRYCSECAPIMALDEYAHDIKDIACKIIGLPLLRDGAKTPPTRHRQLAEGIYITAKADLDTDSDLIELKTYPLDDFARAQARIEAWVYGEPITLIGLNDDTITMETIPVPDTPPIRVEDIPTELLQEHEIFCSSCWEEGRTNCVNANNGGCSSYYDDDDYDDDDTF